MLTKEDLLAIVTKEIELSDGGIVKIRKLKLGEINAGGDEEDMSTKSVRLLSLSLVEPALSPEEVKDLPAEIAIELQEKVMEFNGLSEDSVDEIEKN